MARRQEVAALSSLTEISSTLRGAAPRVQQLHGFMARRDSLETSVARSADELAVYQAALPAFDALHDSTLMVLSGICQFVFGMPAEIVYGRIVQGADIAFLAGIAVAAAAIGGRPDVWVRINPLDSEDADADLETVVPGAPADLVLWDTADHREIPYRYGVRLARRVWKGGTEVA